MRSGTFRTGIFTAILLVHAAAAFGVWQLFTGGMTFSAFWWAVGLYTLSSLGITAGYHRYWTHQAFKARRPLQVFLAIAGGMACEGPILKWYKDHTQHHAYTDVRWDPHTPNLLPDEGFWWAHIGWLFWPVPMPPGYRQTTRLDQDPVVRWQDRWYLPIAVSGFVIPFLAAGWPGLWLAGFIRVVLHWHVTWAVNSVCHRWGEPARTRSGEIIVQRNKSADNWVIALLGMGEGWHATHHADPNSYELGIGSRFWDPGKWFIATLESCGLVSNRRPFAR